MKSQKINLAISKSFVISWPRLTMSPSSRGLGHYPFTVVTGVRIPLGMPSEFCLLNLCLRFDIQEAPDCGNSSVVEHNLAMVGVEGSNPFSRSKRATVILTVALLAFLKEFSFAGKLF